jgi:hypothetical protein
MSTIKRSTQLVALALMLVAAFLIVLNNASAKSVNFSILGITITPTDGGKVTLTPTTGGGKVTLTPTTGGGEPTKTPGVGEPTKTPGVGEPTNTPGHKATPVPHPVTPGGSGNSGILLYSTLFLIAVMLLGASFFIKKPGNRSL